MLLIVSRSHYAPYNIATEEYILQNLAEDVFLLYRNAPSIIVGRHQNTLAEINPDYVKEHGIPVVRRLTGGGTVFHDLGNLNYSFIVKRGPQEDRSFAKYTAPVLSALQELGVDARLEGRNDLTIGGLKFSGNARANYSEKVQQHGTILFSAKIADLSQALRANPLKFADKAVKSVAARVTNITDHLKQPLDLDEFIALIQRQVRLLYPETRDYVFTETEEAAIRKLTRAKYESWEWNFGSSPSYSQVKAVRCAAGTLEFHAEVHRGLITGLRVFGDYFGDRDSKEFELALTGLPHREELIRKVLSSLPLEEFFGPVSPEDILAGLF